MAKLIDKDAVMNTLRKIRVIQSMNIVQEVAFAEGVDAALAVVDVSPTVDAVEVVRCKDCKHCFPVRIPLCGAEGGLRPIPYNIETWYCPLGERKEDGK